MVPRTSLRTLERVETVAAPPPSVPAPAPVPVASAPAPSSSATRATSVQAAAAAGPLVTPVVPRELVSAVPGKVPAPLKPLGGPVAVAAPPLTPKPAPAPVPPAAPSAGGPPFLNKSASATVAGALPQLERAAAPSDAAPARSRVVLLALGALALVALVALLLRRKKD